MKKIKIFLLALLVLILVFSSYLVYEFKLKKYDTQDEVVSDIIEKGIEIALPNGQVIKLDKNGEIIEGATNIEKEIESLIINGMPSLSDSSQGILNKVENDTQPNNGSTKELKEMNLIKAKYEQTFLTLENEARNRINSLIEHAKSEYAAKKVNGEKISYGYFYRKYSAAANELETTTDKAVELVMRVLEAELEQNGYDGSYANSYLTDYQNTKGNLRKSILNKAISF